MVLKVQELQLHLMYNRKPNNETKTYCNLVEVEPNHVSKTTPYV